MPRERLTGIGFIEVGDGALKSGQQTEPPAMLLPSGNCSSLESMLLRPCNSCLR
jgi:hypothetical protein